ncbi:hypothetical protein NZNM25_10410 [Nitrosopumilus zosterae]|uniref:Uncharacterized protein n=1 Tax=Nitrosopumilus zosterae TaxID=718286 RepID=A0A2S2KRE1_9ARCH|nr:hypothetical protein [Nitrosopumilus zosterae]BDQ30315.1 hypothetical protein NZOSNM25_000417 [Nitrosopumilus zosterae]GBH34250.1 hypothetical protein NZNM25_10410 [Nitrosopumilus zosterae]
MKTRFLMFIGMIVISAGFLNTVQGFSDDGFDTGRFSDFHYGEKFYQYQYQPFGALVGDSSSRCHFTSDFILSENSLSESGHAKYKFPNDMIWPGGYESSTFFIINSPSFNFPADNNFEKIIPSQAKDGSVILEFDLVPGLNTFLANSTAFWDSQRSQMIDCPNPFDFEKQDAKYYDFVYPLKVQQNRAMTFDLDKNDFLCKSEFVLIQKYDDSPACVNKQTAVKLTNKEQRSGWNASEQLWKYLSSKMNELYSDNNCPKYCLILDEKYAVDNVGQTLGKTIGLPKFLPDAYEYFQFHHHETYSVIQISPVPISLNTSWNDFYWQDNGIFLRFSETPVTVDANASVEHWAKNHNAKKISLDSGELIYLKKRELGFNEQIGGIYPTLSEAQFVRDGLVISVAGYVSDENMENIVRSFYTK